MAGHHGCPDEGGHPRTTADMPSMCHGLSVDPCLHQSRRHACSSCCSASRRRRGRVGCGRDQTDYRRPVTIGPAGGMGAVWSAVRLGRIAKNPVAYVATSTRSRAHPFALPRDIRRSGGSESSAATRGPPERGGLMSPDPVSRRTRRCRPAAAFTFSVRGQSVFSLLRCSSRWTASTFASTRSAELHACADGAARVVPRRRFDRELLHRPIDGDNVAGGLRSG